MHDWQYCGVVWIKIMYSVELRWCEAIKWKHYYMFLLVFQIVNIRGCHLGSFCRSICNYGQSPNQWSRPQNRSIVSQGSRWDGELKLTIIIICNLQDSSDFAVIIITAVGSMHQEFIMVQAQAVLQKQAHFKIWEKNCSQRFDEKCLSYR